MKPSLARIHDLRPDESANSLNPPVGADGATDCAANSEYPVPAVPACLTDANVGESEVVRPDTSACAIVTAPVRPATLVTFPESVPAENVSPLPTVALLNPPAPLP
jgi:hypothetical protein